MFSRLRKAFGRKCAHEPREPLNLTGNMAENHPHQVKDEPPVVAGDGARKKAGREKKKKKRPFSFYFLACFSRRATADDQISVQEIQDLQQEPVRSSEVLHTAVNHLELEVLQPPVLDASADEDFDSVMKSEVNNFDSAVVTDTDSAENHFTADEHTESAESSHSEDHHKLEVLQLPVFDTSASSASEEDTEPPVSQQFPTDGFFVPDEDWSQEISQDGNFDHEVKSKMIKLDFSVKSLVFIDTDSAVDLRDSPVHLTVDAEAESAVKLTEEQDGTCLAATHELDNDDLCLRYRLGKQLGEEGFGSVFEGIRYQDGLQVAVKFAEKTPHTSFHSPLDGQPIPLEVALANMACGGSRCPNIIELLDWQDYPDHYVMVMERPSPSMDLLAFLELNGGVLNESTARSIMQHAVYAANVCCFRGVFHRDIKLENLLVNPDTLEVKLIDFGCGDFMMDCGYDSFAGTDMYCPPEYSERGSYHAKPATVYSLGVLLYAMLHGEFPSSYDLYYLYNDWSKFTVSPECCDLMSACLQQHPENRLPLESMHYHNWFMPVPMLRNNFDFAESHFTADEDTRFDDLCLRYQLRKQLGEGGFGSVFEGIRYQDGLQVAVKFAEKTPHTRFHSPLDGQPIPLEVALANMACGGSRCPNIIELLDWQDYPDHYVMVMERPSPSMDLLAFLELNGGVLNESTARSIMCQAIYAANVCCFRGVFHRDIKLENLLVNPDTLEVKLIDFGCGDYMTDCAYDSFAGTDVYCPPEYSERGSYHAKPATVYSLGVLLYAMLHGEFPSSYDLYYLDNDWSKFKVSLDCCDLMSACLQQHPENRLPLESMHYHDWFMHAF